MSEEYDSDPDHDDHPAFHPLFASLGALGPITQTGGLARTPEGTTIIRSEGPGYSYVSARTTINTSDGPRNPGNPGVADDEVIADLFSTMLRNIVGEQFAPRPRNPASGEHSEGGAGGPVPHLHLAASFGGLGPRNANSSQAGEAPQVPDINS